MKFNIGDRVRVVSSFRDEDFPEGLTTWLDEMEETIGMEGTIGEIFEDDISIGVDLDNGLGYAYHEKCLEHVA
jgi:hypothetical protein